MAASPAEKLESSKYVPGYPHCVDCIWRSLAPRVLRQDFHDWGPGGERKRSIISKGIKGTQSLLTTSRLQKEVCIETLRSNPPEDLPTGSAGITNSWSAKPTCPPPLQVESAPDIGGESKS